MIVKISIAGIEGSLRDKNKLAPTVICQVIQKNTTVRGSEVVGEGKG